MSGDLTRLCLFMNDLWGGGVEQSFCQAVSAVLPVKIIFSFTDFDKRDKDVHPEFEQA